MKRISIRLADGDMSCLMWDEAGEQAPLLHLAHATGMNAQCYRQLGELLKHRFRIIMSDARGHGFSTLPADPDAQEDWSGFERDLHGLLSHFGEPALLVGHSMGATVTLMYAAASPALVRGVVLIDPAVISLEKADALVAARRAGTAGDNELAAGARKRRRHWTSRAEIREKYDGRGMFAWWKEGILDDYLDGGLITHADGSVSLACAPEWEAATFNCIDILRVWKMAPRLSVPAALLRAEVRSTLTENDEAAFKRLVPHLETQFAPGRSHFLPMEDPGLAADFILRQADRMLARAAA
ncbi:alpha/beta fold hydrolase [Camelimonas abortus]|uniref:Alpha/beta fold hydrolase n=1 Tax=Camelimonas abortus TaxID=1017184 RepID=A0ABV7LB21_9HYPH